MWAPFAPAAWTWAANAGVHQLGAPRSGVVEDAIAPGAMTNERAAATVAASKRARMCSLPAVGGFVKGARRRTTRPCGGANRERGRSRQPGQDADVYSMSR